MLGSDKSGWPRLLVKPATYWDEDEVFAKLCRSAKVRDELSSLLPVRDSRDGAATGIEC